LPNYVGCCVKSPSSRASLSCWTDGRQFLPHSAASRPRAHFLHKLSLRFTARKSITSFCRKSTTESCSLFRSSSPHSRAAAPPS
jgi:hypothetical protein